MQFFGQTSPTIDSQAELVLFAEMRYDHHYNTLPVVNFVHKYIFSKQEVFVRCFTPSSEQVAGINRVFENLFQFKYVGG